MGKRYTPIIAFTGAMWLVALTGYSVFDIADPTTPNRIRFDNAGGIVVFDHIKHAEQYKLPCQGCHHESPVARDNVQSCGTCHGIEFDEAFKASHVTAMTDKASCVTCHHSEFKASSWDHAAHMDDYGLDCTSCHHGEDIEPEPSNCADCHESGLGQKAPNDPAMPFIANAVHTRCADCHQDMFDEGLAGCKNCHEFTNTRALFAETGKADVDAVSADCMVCHEGQKLADLIPNRMGAFHGQCMACHQEAGKGPFQKDQCKQCHTK